MWTLRSNVQTRINCQQVEPMENSMLKLPMDSRSLPMYPKTIAGFIRTLGILGAFPTRLTETDRLMGMIRQLHPVASNGDFVRLGGDGDGGYLVPDDLDGISSCWSAGIGSDSRFERDCAERGLDVFLADGSVPGPAHCHPRFHFTPKFVAAATGVDTLTLAGWMSSVSADRDGDLLLKLDVEGAEYEVLLAAPDPLLSRCRLVIVEFHQLDHLWSAPFFRIASSAFAKLLLTHACVHIHPNNNDGKLCHQGLEMPPTMEFTFLRRDRLPAQPRWRSDFPHRLDQDNTKKPSLPLPHCWYHADTESPKVVAKT